MNAKVVIVSRTRMKSGVCCGGLNADTGEFVRIHNDRGGHLSADAPFQIGEVYDMEYREAWNRRPAPHIEDKQVMAYCYRQTLAEPQLIQLIDRIAPVATGGLDSLFEGCLDISSSYAPFVCQPRVPHHSVCFWRPDAPLQRIEFMGKTKFAFQSRLIPFVGFQPLITHIPAGSLLRLSLAHWWAPHDSDAKRCYLQLSGWYGI